MEASDGTQPDGRMPAMQEALLDWYDRNGRSFPWRDVEAPYDILVLEVMSQQTQLERVETAWMAFLERWPTVEALAATTPGKVIAFWSDHRLGYNRRAEYLHSAASHVVDVWDGTFPRDADALQELDGVGPYTAHAVASFAFDEPVAVVDTNVKRVLHRALSARGEQYDELASEILPPDAPGTWNNAMMDLGATICTSTPACESCPFRTWCDAYALEDFGKPETSTQPTFRGSRRQYRGRIVRTLADAGPMDVDALGHRIRDGYDPAGDPGRAWLHEILTDLAEEGLVAFDREAATVHLPD